MKPKWHGKQVMVQQGARSKDISDIISIGSDDASDYMAATGTTEASASEEESTESNSEEAAPKSKSKDKITIEAMSDKEIKKAMAKMTPR